MSVQLQLRRGTTGLHSTFTGAPGEITVDTTKNTAVVHDGVTAGGYALAKENNAQLTGVTTVFDLSITGEIQSDLIPDVDITRDLGSSTKRWKDLYLSGSSIYLDDKVISTNINGFDFGSSVLKVGDL
jgi:hypothetical protein